MFQAIKSSISEFAAKELYPDKYMILLVEDTDTNTWIGDLIFVGTERERRKFDSENKCPNGYLFFMIKGTLLEMIEAGSVQPVTPLHLEDAQYAI